MSRSPEDTAPRRVALDPSKLAKKSGDGMSQSVDRSLDAIASLLAASPTPDHVAAAKALPSRRQNITREVSAAMQEALRPWRVKDIMESAGLGKPVASRMKRGMLPNSGTLLTAMARLGGEFRAKLLQPILGEDRAADLALDARLEKLGLELAAMRAEIGGRRNAELETQDQSGIGHNSRMATAGSGEAEAVTVAGGRIVAVRRSWDTMLRQGYWPLVDHLKAWSQRMGRLEIARAVELARGDPNQRTGLIVRKNGAEIERVPASQNRLAAAHDPDYHAFVQAGLDDLERTGEPALFDVDARVKLDGGRVVHSRSMLLRTVDRTRDGSMIFMACYVPVGA